MFRWTDWILVYLTRPSSQLERWALQALHSRGSLIAIAGQISLSLKSKRVQYVHVESVWIDGTPQAIGSTMSGKNIKCELGDLLLVLEMINRKGVTTQKNALVIQAKSSDSHNILSAGKSTQNEIDLLCDLDTSKPIKLISGFQRGSRLIGSYTLNSGTGLQSGATFLNMPRHLTWRDVSTHRRPYLCGTPSVATGYNIRIAAPYNKYLEKFANFKAGRKYSDPPGVCQWSKMILDLLNNYRPIVMSGYSHQPRVRSITYFLANAFGPSKLIISSMVGVSSPKDASSLDHLPHISTIYFTVYSDSEE